MITDEQTNLCITASAYVAIITFVAILCLFDFVWILKYLSGRGNQSFI